MHNQKLIKLSDVQVMCVPNKLEYIGNTFDHVAIFDSNNKQLFDNGFYFRKMIKINDTNETLVGTFIIENLYMAYSNSWIINYQHLISDFYPYLYYYKMLHSDIYIGIPEFIKSQPLNDLIDLIGIDKNKIIWLRDNVIHQIKNFYTYRYGKTLVIQDLNWSIPPLKHLNSILNKNRSNINSKILFISRDDIVTADNNNNFAGKARDVINKDQLYDYLKQNNIDIEYMSKFSIIEKNKLLSQYDTFITLYGANIINLVFAKDIKNLIILCNKQNASYIEYYKVLLEKMYDHTINIISIPDLKAHRYFNQPYIVNINSLHTQLLSINNNLKINKNYTDNDIFNKYKTDEEFLNEYLFKKLLDRTPNQKEVDIHLKHIKERGRYNVFYEFTSCYEYHIKNSSEFMSNLLKSKGTL